MNVTLDQIAPEVAQAIIAQATTQGLSVNDYLRHLLGLSNGTDGADAELAMNEQRNEEKPQRNEAMFAALQHSAERLKDMPVRGSTEETLKMIRRARAGEMWGYEPTDADTE